MVDRKQHPDETTWEQLAHGELAPSVRDAWFDHILECEQCTQVWRGLTLLKTEAEAQGLVVDTPTAATRSWWMPLAAAATLVLAVGGFLITRPTVSDTEVVRSSTALPAIEGLMMAYDPQNIPTLVWPPVPTATGYVVEVFTDDGRPTWRREVAAPPLRWPAETPRTKGAYRWRVEALNADGPLARSRLTPMELAR